MVGNKWVNSCGKQEPGEIILIYHAPERIRLPKGPSLQM